MNGSRFDAENFYDIGFNDPYDRLSSQVQRNHHESLEERKKADELVLLREKQRKNRFLGNEGNDISARNVRKVRGAVSKPKFYMNKFKCLVTGVVVASAIVAGASVFNGEFSSSSSFDDISMGEIYNDPNGYQTFENGNVFREYCENNGINISDTKGHVSSDGKVYVSASSLNNSGDFVSDSDNFTEVSKGEVYSDGYKKFDNENDLREYCEDNGISMSSVKGFASSDGAIYVSASSVSLDNTINSGYSR